MNIDFKKLLIVFSAVVMISACDDDNDYDNSNLPAPIGNSYVRVIHGSPDAPAVNVNVNGSAALTNVDFAAGSGFVKLRAEANTFTVDGILADGSTTQVLDLGSLTLMDDYEYTVFAHGVVMEDGDSANDLAAAIIANPMSEVGAGNIRLQVLHGSSAAPMVDLHVTGATDPLGSALGTLSYGEFTDQLEVPAGVYRVRLVISAGQTGEGTVAFDAVLPDLPAGSDWFIAATTKTGVTTSPVFLIANNGTDQLSIVDDRTSAWVRVVHTAADVPNVDILADGTKVDALSNAPFLGATGYVPIDMGTYQIDTVLTADNSVVGISESVMVDADMAYTVNAVGTLAAEAGTDIPLEYYILVDDVRRIATEAQIRLTHAHPSVGNVDIYVTADGMIDMVEPTFTDVPYKASTGFVSLPAGDYVVQITPTGAKTPVAIDTGTVSLMAGGVYSATAVNNAGGMPANLILQDDFVN